MSQIMSILMLLTGFVILWCVGFPFTHFAFSKADKRLSNDGIHALSLFSGYALIICIELLLVPLDIPVKFTAWPLLIGALIVCVIYIRKNKETIAYPSKQFLFYALIILVISGFSFVIIGAQFFKGFAWWDTLYYASHAEFLKNLPFSSLDSKVFDLPYLGSSYHYFHGTHRIGRGVFQAFIASVYFVDGSSTLGFMNVLGVLLVYLGVVYALDGFPLSTRRKYFIAFAATVVPNVVITQMEGFIPIGLFTAFTVVLVRLFMDVLVQKQISTAILGGILGVSFFTTLLDGTYVVLGMIILSALILLFTKEFNKVYLLNIGVILLTIVIFVFPYREQFSIELGGSVTRSSLNFIYSFANSSLGLNWIFWGRTLTGSYVPDKLFLVMTFLSICFFIASYVGVFFTMYKGHRREGFTMLALCLMPFVFLSMKEGNEALDLRYSYFKVLTFAVPLIVVGLMNFFYIVLDWIKEISVNELDTFYKGMYQVTHRILFGLVLLLIVAFSISSIERVSLPLRVDWMKNRGISDRASNLIRFNDAQAQAFYTQLMRLEDENILLVGANDDLGLWWSTYYGRNNSLYTLTNSVFKTYIKDFPEVDMDSIPDDVVIMVTPDNKEKAIVPAQKQDSLALSVKTSYNNEQHLYVKNDAVMNLDELELLVYSKQEVSETVSFDIDVLENESVTLNVQGRTYVITQPERLSVRVDLLKGAQKIPFNFNGASLVEISNVSVGATDD
ncbi:hypothetical protein AOC36_02460 [Erysipelothrix larvae]|uniref:Glycosyltransferase RgtA/B/C/D-like domain-containing protein n=1 Tax=Erysipelothrix larvae TaxID=1514105 RepID=A0A0X8GYT1_9FIRM|nr:hypothetical protein [Erysipelothrix larvae]AMC92884.1 hypothetical protein AOC36_02460 [Erysipelothrix larvae]